MRWKPLARLADFVYGRLAPAVLAPVLWVAADVTLGLTHSFLAAGRLDRVLERSAAEAGERAPAPTG